MTNQIEQPNHTSQITHTQQTDLTGQTDDSVLQELRTECRRWEGRDELEGGFRRLYTVRDEALRRGLPVPASCPLDGPAE